MMDEAIFCDHLRIASAFVILDNKVILVEGEYLAVHG